MGRALRRLSLELRRAPSPAEAEAAQARAYARPAWLDPYAAPAYVESGLFDSERALLGTFLRPGERLLLLGCGTGRDALGFARAGLLVTARDPCPEAIARAPAASGVTFEVGGLSAPEGQPRSFDAALLSSDVYGSFPLRENRVAALARLARLVRPGGVVLFPTVFFPRPRRARAVLLDAFRRLLGALLPGRLEPGDRWLSGPEGQPLYRHAFLDEGEVRAEVEAAGLAFERDPRSSFVAARRPADPGPDGRRFRHDAQVVAEPRGDDLLLVHLRFGTTFRLNATGRAIWPLAGQGLSSSEIAARLRAELAVDEGRLEQDARELLLDLERHRLLVRAS